MTGDRSLAEPILICGILGGMLGGLNCCCWFAPLASSFLAVRWSRNLRGPHASVTWAGFRSSLISALIMGTFGTAFYLYLNDPSRMSAEQQALLESVLGGSGMSDLPMGAIAAGHTAIATTVGLVLGFVGTLLAGGGASPKRASGLVPPRPAPVVAPTSSAAAPPAPTTSGSLDAPAAPAVAPGPPPKFASAARFLDATADDFASSPAEEQAWGDPKDPQVPEDSQDPEGEE